MTEEKPQELLIIKRVRGGGDSGHGGAWKIAFADFMTAMMALFLVLWLISATNEKTKAALARYFNPVKLVDLTIQKRGLNDPKERSAEDASNNAPPPSKTKAASNRQAKPVPQPVTTKQSSGSGAGYLPTHSEAALFRDPYAVLGEIAAAGAAVKTPNADHSNVGAAASFQDPFQVAAPEVPQQTAPQAAETATSERAPQSAIAPPKAVPAQQPKVQQPAQATGQPSAAAMADRAPEDLAASAAASGAAPAVKDQAKPAKDQPPAVEVQATRLQQEIATALGKEAAPNVEVKPTSQGVLISLTDGYDYAMFAIGSAEPQRQTLQIMAKIARILKSEKGTIIISGHTDGRRYRSRSYDNWRLSTARAEMALYMLVRGGLDEKRIERIEGAADHDLKVPHDPMAAQNRRIEILLRKTNS